MNHAASAAALFALVLATGCGAESASPDAPASAGVSEALPSGSATRGGEPAEASLPRGPRGLQAASSGRETASEALRRILSRYRGCAAYTDRAEVVLRYRLEDQPYEERAPLAVSYSAPGRLAVNAYRAVLVSDGTYLWGILQGASSGGLQDQVLRRDVAERLRLEDLLGDSVLARELAAGWGGPPPQLQWILDDQPPGGLDAPGIDVSRLRDGEIQGRPAQRFAVGEEEAGPVYWVDSESEVVRRLELPVSYVLPELVEQDAFKEVALAVEFHEARFAAAGEGTFRFDPLPGMRQVSQFVVPPLSLPSPLLGRPAPAFRLRSSEGTLAVSDGADGRVNVLAWIANHPSSHEALLALERVAGRSGADPREQFLVIMAEQDPRGSTGELLERWGIAFPWTDDAAAVGRDVFGVRDAPTLVVLDARGVVAWFSARWGPGAEEALAGVLQQLAAGHDPAAQAVRWHEQAHREYSQRLDAVTLTQGTAASQ